MLFYVVFTKLQDATRSTSDLPIPKILDSAEFDFSKLNLLLV